MKWCVLLPRPLLLPSPQVSILGIDSTGVAAQESCPVDFCCCHFTSANIQCCVAMFKFTEKTCVDILNLQFCILTFAKQERVKESCVLSGVLEMGAPVACVCDSGRLICLFTTIWSR